VAAATRNASSTTIRRSGPTDTSEPASRLTDASSESSRKRLHARSRDSTSLRAIATAASSASSESTTMVFETPIASKLAERAGTYEPPERATGGASDCVGVDCGGASEDGQVPSSSVVDQPSSLDSETAPARSDDDAFVECAAAPAKSAVATAAPTARPAVARAMRRCWRRLVAELVTLASIRLAILLLPGRSPLPRAHTQRSGEAWEGPVEPLRDACDRLRLADVLGLTEQALDRVVEERLAGQLGGELLRVLE
jgi:hypothetical protein